jgi:hypothetical protein
MRQKKRLWFVMGQVSVLICKQQSSPARRIAFLLLGPSQLRGLRESSGERGWLGQNVPPIGAQPPVGQMLQGMFDLQIEFLIADDPGDADLTRRAADQDILCVFLLNLVNEGIGLSFPKLVVDAG